MKKQMEMKQKIRIDENKLKQIVDESIRKVVYNEGIVDRVKGAFNGFKKGDDVMQITSDDANKYRKTLQFVEFFIKQAKTQFESSNIEMAYKCVLKANDIIENASIDYDSPDYD